jgi:uncharacterized membrane protein
MLAAMKRWFRHLLTPGWWLRRTFPAAALEEIDTAVTRAEATHHAEIRVAIESALSLAQLWRGTSARERAMELFSELRMWDTAANNGVLIYVLLAEKRIEIIADRGFSGRVSPAQWAEVCAGMQAAFQAGRNVEGLKEAIAAVSALAAAAFPLAGRNIDELPDRTVVLT